MEFGLGLFEAASSLFFNFFLTSGGIFAVFKPEYFT